jgi:multidrug efflux pump subunit AcrA (membrane-fusion protein)
MKNQRPLVLLAALAVACRRPQPSPSPSPEEEAPKGATPVKVVAVSKATIPEVVSGPGHTLAFLQQKVRAPYSGTLTELRVVDGNVVHAGDVVGVIVSRDSEAAVAGADELLRQAKTETERADAERAVDLARRGLVKTTLRIPSSGVVLGHAASAGDRVSEDQEILTVSTLDSIVFQADVPQADLGKVRPGEAASVLLAGRKDPLPGQVHDILANANPTDLTIPVRIDPRPQVDGLGVGLFGTARIFVGERRDVPVLPPAAVILDDVTGKARIATVAEGKVHWVEVTTGLEDKERIEIRTPTLDPGTKVIVAGQVGLPEESPVTIEP